MPLLKKIKLSEKLKKKLAENSLKYYAKASAGLLNNALELKDKMLFALILKRPYKPCLE